MKHKIRWEYPSAVAHRVSQMEVMEAWKEWYKEGFEMTNRTMKELKESFSFEEEDTRVQIEEYKEEANNMTNEEVVDHILKSIPEREEDRTFLDWVYVTAADRLPEDE